MTVKDSTDPAHRRRTITTVSTSPHLVDLGISELRQYRQQLTDEEERVSYWRRLTHARIDVLEAESRADGVLSLDDLIRVLGDTGTGRTRKALLSVKASDPLPDLPALEDMWVSEVDPHDHEQLAYAVRQLRSAEKQLTDYRRVLHERIDEATAELISRYRDDPSAALLALPKG